MKTFLIIWFGQLVSLMGTAMTRFALLIWAYQQTGQATTLALLGFFSFVPFVLVSPLAGTWVDKLDRRWVMAVADLGAGIITIVLLLLHQAENLQIWHLYVAQTAVGVFDAFQRPAYEAMTSLLVQSTQYTRINGLRSLAIEGANIAAPILAGALLPFILLEGVLWVDVVTFLVAMVTLAIVHVPAPPILPTEPETSRRKQLSFGLRYIWQQKGLFGLMLIFMGINLFAALTYFGLLPAMILARTGGDEVALASVLAALGVGGVIGALVLSIWGGPRKKIHGALGFTAVSFLLGDLTFALGRSVPVWIVAALMASFFIPILIGCRNAIWQEKVPPAWQGRVFSTRMMMEQATMPIGYLLAGPLADNLLEPLMMANGRFTHLFAPLVGTGAGSGMALMFVFTAFAGCLMSLLGYAFPAIRQIEDAPENSSLTNLIEFSQTS